MSVTTKPSEAEMQQSAAITTALARLLDAAYMAEPPDGATCDAWREAAADAKWARDALVARIRELEAERAKWEAASLADEFAAAHARAEAAEKRVAELLDARIADTAAITKAWGKVLRLEAELAAIREALEVTVDFIATGDFADDARRQVIAKAESALAGASAPPPLQPTCPICDGDHP